MYIKKYLVLILCLCLASGLFTGCGSSKKEASQILTTYLDHLIAGDYSLAYMLLSDFDKGNIKEEDFIKWQELASRIYKASGFTIDKSMDTFKNYEYLGSNFGTVYGLKVERTQEMLIPDVQLAGYDKDVFRIMVQSIKNDSRVLLLLTNIDETAASYDAYLKKYEKK